MRMMNDRTGAMNENDLLDEQERQEFDEMLERQMDNAASDGMKMYNSAYTFELPQWYIDIRENEILGSLGESFLGIIKRPDFAPMYVLYVFGDRSECERFAETVH